MKLYTGIKKILAKPMTRQEYNDYRGWELPKDEDGNDEGMLVEYLNSPNSNHPNHDGYISWSPINVFNEAHQETPTKVNYDDVAAILNKSQYVFNTIEGTTGTTCHVFYDGFIIGYGMSACVDPNMYDREIGEREAKKTAVADATRNIWQMEGWRLKTTASVTIINKD